MIYSIDEYRNIKEAHLIDGKTIDEVCVKVAKLLDKDSRFNVLHFRKYNYTGNINGELSRKRHAVRRVQAQQL